MAFAFCIVFACATVAPAPPQKSSQAAKPVAAKDALHIDFDSANYRNHGFPGYLVTYAVFRNPKKQRPLFSIGRGKGGGFDVHFETGDLGEEQDIPDSSTGEAQLVLEFRDEKRGHWCFFRGEEWNTYACGQWTQSETPPTIEATISNLRDWKAKDKLLRKFMNADKAKGKNITALPSAAPPPEPCFTAKVDLTLRVGQTKTLVKDIPCDVRLIDLERCWGMKFVLKTTLQGVDLGLVGDDADSISLYLVTQGFCVLGKAHRAPTLDADDKGVPALKIDD
jgi:hypothetical protein